MNVLTERGAPKDLARMQKRFLKEIVARIRQEQQGSQHYPTRTPNQFYLRRRQPGMPATHRNCQLALAAGVLDPTFVSNLSGWNLELLRP